MGLVGSLSTPPEASAIDFAVGGDIVDSAALQGINSRK